VFKERDGSIRFTNKTPPPGTSYQIFTAKKSSFSIYQSTKVTNRNFKLFKNAYNDIIKKVAVKNKVPPHLIKAVIHVESAFNHKAISPKGARGLMQLMPGTARDLGVKNVF